VGDYTRPDLGNPENVSCANDARIRSNEKGDHMRPRGKLTLEVIRDESGANHGHPVGDDKPNQQGICDDPPLFPKGLDVKNHDH